MSDIIDIVMDPRVPKKCKIHPTIIQQCIEKMKVDPYRNRSLKHGRKWVETVELDVIYVVAMRSEVGKEVLIGIRRAKRRR